MTFKTNLLPQTNGGYELGSSSLGWKITKLNVPTTSNGSTYGAGSNGQALLSNGSTVYWGTINTIPSGGSAGQVLTKNSDTNYDVGWITPVVIRGTGTDSALVVNETQANTASGEGAFAAGSNTIASNRGAFAIGGSSIASGDCSFAGGTKSSAVNYPTTSSGNYSFAYGLSAKAEGASSVAFGQRPTASALGSAAIGNNVAATGRASMVVGQFNVEDTNPEDSSHGAGARKYLFTIGNGTADDARSNAMTVDWDGNLKVSGDIENMPFKYGNTSGIISAYQYTGDDHSAATGDGSLALGFYGTASGLASFVGGTRVSEATGNNESSGSSSFAFGTSVKATANTAVAFGNTVTASGIGSVGFGSKNTASGNASFVAGQNNIASGVLSSAFGSQNKALGRAQTVIGQYNIEDDINDTTYSSYGTGALKNLFIIGNGTSSTRSNAMTVDWNGNEEISGKLTAYKGFNTLFSNGSYIAGANNSGTYTPLKWYFDKGIIPSNGDIFIIQVPSISNGEYGVYLSLNNGTNYYPIAGIGSTRLVNQYAVNSYIAVVFETNGAVNSVYPLDGGTARTNISTGGIWRVLNYYDSNTYSSAYCTTGASTVAKSASCSGFTLQPNSYIHIIFTNTNTATNPTLNINSTGAKPIFVNGAAATTSNLVKGSYLAYYDGTNYQLRTDGKLPANISGSAEKAGITTTTNAVAYYTDAAGTFGTKASANGALYATSANGALNFGTLPIAQGGTGKTSATEAWTALGGGSVGKLSTNSSTTQFLRGDGTWQTPPVTQVAGKTGDVTLGTLTIGSATYNGSSNTTVTIADLGIASPTTFWGLTSTNLSDGSTTATVNITVGPTTGNRTVTSSDNGVVVMEANSGEEYIWTGSKWNAMGLASSYALAQHIHGNITNSGTITSTGVALANNDRLLFSDNSNNGKIERSSITFDGSTTTKALTQKGTFENIFPVYHSNLDYTSVSPSIGAYPLNGQTHPVTGATEYGSALSLPGISESSKHYGAQLVISSASGADKPTHAYIRRLTSTPSWSDWSTLLDNNNFKDYAVDRTGDTMSGGLTISTNDNPNIRLKNTDMDITASSLSASEYSSLYFRDKNDNVTAFIQNAQVSSDGHSYLQISSRTFDADNNILGNYFTLHSYKDGTRSVTISHPAAWRTGLNAQKQHSTISSLTITFSNSTTATATATGVTSSNSVIVTPTPAQWTNWRDNSIRCTAQATDSLTFTADSAITLTTYANVMIFD